MCFEAQGRLITTTIIRIIIRITTDLVVQHHRRTQVLRLPFKQDKQEEEADSCKDRDPSVSVAIPTTLPVLIRCLPTIRPVPLTSTAAIIIRLRRLDHRCPRP